VTFVCGDYQATLERSVRELGTNQSSPLTAFENETLVMALALLGALIADTEQVLPFLKLSVSWWLV